MAEADGLVVRDFDQPVADFRLQADFSVMPGERLVIRGASGCGKTTLLRHLAGLEPPPEKGKILLGGRDVTRELPQNREMGYVAQEPALFESLSLLENAAFGLRMRGFGSRERRAQALPWLERLGLRALADTSVSKLSGGEKSRVAFVRAIVWRPRCLLLDEPFSALDLRLRATIRQELVALHQQWPVPLVLVTHDEEDAREVGTRQLVLHVEGQLRRLGSA